MNPYFGRLNGERCPFCGNTSLRPFTAFAHDSPNKSARVRLIECTRCIVAWQWPVARSAQDSARAFDRQYEEHQEGTYFDRDKKAAIARMEADFVASLLTKPAALLDAGAGDGIFLAEALRRGWNARGFDLSPGAVAEYRAAGGGLEMFCGDFNSLEPGDRFDVITAWDVIEHVDDPVRFLKQAKQRLAPDGVLILETGNYQTCGRVYEGDRWWCYQLDHRWNFSPAALERLLRHAGFREFRLADHVLRPHWTGPKEFAGPSLAHHLRRSLFHPWRLASEISLYRSLRDGASRWGKWGNLDIFTIAASEAPLRAPVRTAAGVTRSTV